MAKVKGSVWCGFLEAGNKGSPVVRDDRLGTRNPATIYLFNFTKDRIIEYRRDIVETKLRELTPEEEAAVKQDMLAGFEVVRNRFVPRATARRQVVAPPREELPDVEFDDDDVEITPEPDDLDEPEMPAFA